MTNELEEYIVYMLNNTFVEEFVKDVLREGVATADELLKAGFLVPTKYL